MIGMEADRAAPDEGDDLTSGDEAMIARLTRTLEEAGIYVGPELDGDTLVLSGEVDTEENRQAALDVARAVANSRGLRIEESIDVLQTSPDEAFLGRDLAADALPDGDFAYADPDANPQARFDPTFELEPDFTTDIGTTNSEEAAAEATPYFPPTDPVVRPTNDAEELAVVGGFGATAMDTVVGAAGFDARNDEGITQEVLGQLAADALTIDLTGIRAVTRDGVVTLRGEVLTLEDAENAEAVASRVAGVQEVREELTIPGLRTKD